MFYRKQLNIWCEGPMTRFDNHAPVIWGSRSGVTQAGREGEQSWLDQVRTDASRHQKAAVMKGRNFKIKGTVLFGKARVLFFPIANLFIFSPFSFRSRFALNFLTVWSKTWWFPDQKFNYEVILILTRNKIFWGSLINYRILIEKLPEWFLNWQKVNKLFWWGTSSWIHIFKPWRG